MALPVVDTNQPEVKELIKGSVKDIANTIFASASVSITAAAKAVAPSIPQMVADITEDLRAGPVNRFSQGLEKLDKLLQNFGGDIKDYSKELAKFVSQREARISKSEKTIRELRENNVKAEVNRFGEIKILSRTEIDRREKQLKAADKLIKTEKDKIATNQKLVQEEKGNTKARREAIVTSQEKIIKTEEKREKLLKTLNKKEEDTSNQAQMSISERASKFVDDYVPDQIRDIGGALIDGLMAPVNAVKDLGRFFGSLLKPLKALPKLFKGFIKGMMGVLKTFIPFLLIGLAVTLAIGAIVIGFIKLKEVIEENKLKLIAFKDRIMEIPGQIKDFFSEKFTALGESFSAFGEKVKAIPDKISEFFKGVFNTIQNFFINAINGAIELINKIKPGKDIELLENVPMPASEPAEIVPVENNGTVAAAQSGVGTATANGPPFLNTNNSQANTNNAAVAINNNAVNNNTTVGSAASAKNNDFSRMSLYSDMSP